MLHFIYVMLCFFFFLADVTPSRITKTSSPVSFVSRTIHEEQDHLPHHHNETLVQYDTERHRSKSVSQTSRKSSSSTSSSPHHVASILNLETTITPTEQGYHHSILSSALSNSSERNATHFDKSKTSLDVETPGSESDSGYADPIDALRQYYNSQQQNMDFSSRKKVSVTSDPPYQTLEEIQRARLIQMDPDDPTYSRPFDCLRGLPGPVRISGENSTGFVMLPPPVAGMSSNDRHFPRPILRGSSDEAISTSPSPSPSPEPQDIRSLRRSQRCGSLDHLLSPMSSEVRKVPVKFKDDSAMMRLRVSSEGNLLSKMRQQPSRPDILSPLALTVSTASERDCTSSSSPQPSPIHAPMPVEVTRLYNGSAKFIQHHDLSISHSQ